MSVLERVDCPPLQSEEFKKEKSVSRTRESRSWLPWAPGVWQRRTPIFPIFQGKARGTGFPRMILLGREGLFFLRVNEKTVLLRNYFMHISLCFHSTSKANEIQAKQRRGGTPAKYPHLKRNQAIKSARVTQHKYKYKCKIGWKDGEGCSLVTSLERVVTWAGKRVLSNSKAKFKIESFNRPEINTKKKQINQQQPLSWRGNLNRNLASATRLIRASSKIISLCSGFLSKLSPPPKWSCTCIQLRKEMWQRTKSKTFEIFPPASGRTWKAVIQD